MIPKEIENIRKIIAQKKAKFQKSHVNFNELNKILGRSLENIKPNLLLELTAHEIISDLKFLEIIGDIDNDDMIPIETVRRIRLNPKVKIFKSMAQGDLASRMQSWDLQVFLSKREGLGNVILEAGACGVPTLGWDIIGVQDAIPYFAKNCLIPYGNFHILQEAILSFIDKPLTQSEKKTLSQWYIDNYDQTKVLKSFVVFIMSCLGDGYGTKKN